MNAQQIFDTVARHLFTQGKAAQDDSGMCRYRNEDGTRCAVGCLIPDELYDPRMETHGFAQLIQEFRADLPDFMLEGQNPNLLARLQRVHDLSEFRAASMAQGYAAARPFDFDAVTSALTLIAEDFDLNTEVLQ